MLVICFFEFGFVMLNVFLVNMEGEFEKIFYFCFYFVFMFFILKYYLIYEVIDSVEIKCKFCFIMYNVE